MNFYKFKVCRKVGGGGEREESNRGEAEMGREVSVNTGGMCWGECVGVWKGVWV